MKKIWWLIGILALILLLISVREGFAVSQCPSGFVEDKRIGEGTPMARLRCKKETGQPKCPDGYTMTPFVKMAEGQYNGGTCDKGGESTVARCEGDAMLNVINDKQVCVEYEFVRLGGTETTGASAGATGTTAPDPSCPSGFTIDSEKLTCKPTTGVAPSCPSGYPVSDSSPNSVKCFQTTLNEGEFRIKECPTGTTRREGGLCYGASQSSTCPSGFQLDRQQIHDGTGNIRSVGKCKSTGGTTGASAGATGTTGGTTSGTGMTTSGTTTGGSSTSSYGPTSGGGRRGQIFGPTFNGIGNDGKVRPMDSSKTNNYPELLGGGDGKPSTRIDGAGIVDPSKNWQLANDGSLPNCTSLGCDENSRYFPYSRQPGDMELIPDPYRVSQQFSSASYSFKTEPTPFLTDFSAFLR